MHLQIKQGTIVKSIAGHDGGGFYVVVKTDNENSKTHTCFIADGRTRKLAKPKRKNERHLSLTGVAVDIDQMDTDRKIRQALWPYQYGKQAVISKEGG